MNIFYLTPLEHLFHTASSCAEVCNSYVSLMKVWSDVLTVKRYNGFQARKVSKRA